MGQISGYPRRRKTHIHSESSGNKGIWLQLQSASCCSCLKQSDVRKAKHCTMRDCTIGCCGCFALPDLDPKPSSLQGPTLRPQSLVRPLCESPPSKQPPQRGSCCSRKLRHAKAGPIRADEGLQGSSRHETVWRYITGSVHGNSDWGLLGSHILLHYDETRRLLRIVSRPLNVLVKHSALCQQYCCSRCHVMSR